jgi:beta-phosphoglucomutase-like phosphatase (HAD superfamily)
MALVEKHLDPDWFDVIAAGDIVPRKKPAPDIYYYVLEQLDLQATECLVLEDSEHGLTAANAAGIPTIITINNYTRSQDFRQAILVVDHLGEPHKPMSLIRGNIATDYLYIDQLQQLHQSLV